MKNILSIARYDLKKVTGSVVALITMMGLCIVPCLYAWFNIFSNWSPYESEATGRILVAVANTDEGCKAAGLTINVGDKIVSALEANDDIGWTFTESEEEAKAGVLAGRYYAALVIPGDFSAGVMSFMNGDLTNPKLRYYENEKKNAIAPKITGKAKTALQEEVNAAFVGTLASYVTDAASVAEAGGTDPSEILNDLSDRVEALGRDVDSCIVLSDSAAGLTTAAGSLLDASDALVGSTQDALSSNDKVLKGLQKKLTLREAKAVKARDEAEAEAADTSELLTASGNMAADILALDRIGFRSFIRDDRDKWVAKVDEKQKKISIHASLLSDAGFSVLSSRYSSLASKLGDISADLSALSQDMSYTERVASLKTLTADIAEAERLIKEIRKETRIDIDETLAAAMSDTRSSVAAFRKAMSDTNSDLGELSSLMESYGGSVRELHSAVENTSDNLRSLQKGSDAIAGMLSNAAGSELLRTLNGLLAGDEASVAEYLSNPVKMDTKVYWQIENYGSAMAPFYTVLAQWVGALLTAVLIKVKVRRRKDLQALKLHEWFFGRYGLYLLVGISQALIVSLGDLLYIGIQCPHPVRFVLAACLNGIVFTMINYALVFALDNIGLGAGVIILVLQVAGAGGTYPVEVLPRPFQVIYPLMPFRYSMDAMRECIAGMYGSTYAHCTGILAAFFIFAVAFGLALYHPARRLNEMIAASKAKSEIML